MKKLLILLAAAGMLFTACDNNEPDLNNYAPCADLVGTWTCLNSGYAEALTIKADGSALSTGVESGELWEEVRGIIVTQNNTVKMTFEDGDNFEGHFDIIPGEAFSLVNENGERCTYRYCANDLSDEILGMWVYNGSSEVAAGDMIIQTFAENGTVTMSGLNPATGEYVVEGKIPYYDVVGDMLFYATDKADVTFCRLTYSPNAVEYGDILVMTDKVVRSGKIIEVTYPFLRIKQSLNLANQSYDYSNIYVTNVSGLDKDFEFGGQTLNFATLDGALMDKMMKTILFNVSFPTVGKISYNCYYNGKYVSTVAPIAVAGNKITVKMSERNPAYRDIDLYAFQDVDDCQFHIYMPTTSFEKFFANISAVLLAENGQLDLNNASAVAELYAKIDDAIQSINVSLIFKETK